MRPGLEENLTTVHVLVTLLNIDNSSNSEVSDNYYDYNDSDDSYKSDDFDDSDNCIEYDNFVWELDNSVNSNHSEDSNDSNDYDSKNSDYFTLKTMTTFINVTESHFGKRLFEEHLGAMTRVLASRKEAADPASHTKQAPVGAVLSSKNWELCTRQAAAGVISHFWRVDLMGLPVPYIMDPCWIEKTNSSGYFRKVCEISMQILDTNIFILCM